MIGKIKAFESEDYYINAIVDKINELVDVVNAARPALLSDEIPTPYPTYECCASGSCEVCRPGYYR